MSAKKKTAKAGKGGKESSEVERIEPGQLTFPDPIPDELAEDGIDYAELPDEYFFPEPFILASGKHHRQENEARRTYYVGDKVRLTLAEWERAGDKFLSQAEYDRLVESFVAGEQAERALRRSQRRRAKESGAAEREQDEDAAARGEQLRKIQGRDQDKQSLAL